MQILCWFHGNLDQLTSQDAYFLIIWLLLRDIFPVGYSPET